MSAFPELENLCVQIERKPLQEPESGSDLLGDLTTQVNECFGDLCQENLEKATRETKLFVTRVFRRTGQTFSELVSRNHLATGPGTDCPPNILSDRILDKADTAIGHQGIDPAGVPASSRKHSIVMAERAIALL